VAFLQLWPNGWISYSCGQTVGFWMDQYATW